MNYEVKHIDKFRFIEEGEGEPLILLHGLFGALSNFKDLIEHFKHLNRVIVPILPLFELDLFHTTVGGLEKHVHKFIETKNYHNIHLLGNSLGGHVALLHVLKEFNKLIPNSELYFIDKCGHAPMMEVPAEFNILLEQFLSKLKHPAATVA